MRSLQLDLHNVKIENYVREETLSAISHILKSISPLLFNTIRLLRPSNVLYVHGHVVEHFISSDSTRNPLPLCSTIDAALAHENYGSLVKGTWDGRRQRYSGFGSDHLIGPYKCNNALCRDLFPKLAARGIFDECDGECWIHRCVIDSILNQPLVSHTVFLGAGAAENG